MSSRIFFTVPASLLQAMMRIWLWQIGQLSGRASWMRASSLAHRCRATARWRDSSRLAAEAGAGGTAAEASAVTTGRSEALGANTP